MTLQLVAANSSHLPALLAIEAECFNTDRLSKRSFQHWLKSGAGIFCVALFENQVAGYALAIKQRGTTLARLYSIAVLPSMQGQGISTALINELEAQAVDAGRLYMRLEVAKKNTRAIKLYKHLGYSEFGEYQDYYQDHDDAVRMQKNIWRSKPLTPMQTPAWVAQTTDFTCGPASLLMAMSAQNSASEISIEEELAIWRTATTIFMTSGHGGTHPFGLALAAVQRGFTASVKVSSSVPLFVEGVRSEHKKAVMTRVHHQFLQQMNSAGVQLDYSAPSIDWISEQLSNGASVLVLISTYQLDKRKAPHWVCVTHIDEHCIYVHDPDVGDHQTPLDCQHMPIARSRFDSMSAFGRNKLRTAIAIKRR
ncbi:GNAT family N-acetyltransferase/peptidase C39 family protein [Salinibius halmophilus]|uniref:GNAT family N-acetyltransferase/peptidase C39 family protein n=1 Tax=Salinibius halmophilus TaxID=1853216 RepID=UPI000E67625F|nr:GNAT family N-acetyltransferase/peptidase C39 family protein [Salinibius halmophilus]